MQGLAHIDVAEACNNSLIQQGGLEGRLLGAEFPCEIATVEFIAKRFHANAFQQLVGCQLTFVQHVHDAKAAGIGVNHASAIIERDHYMVMGTGT